MGFLLKAYESRKSNILFAFVVSWAFDDWLLRLLGIDLDEFKVGLATGIDLPNRFDRSFVAVTDDDDLVEDVTTEERLV